MYKCTMSRTVTCLTIFLQSHTDICQIGKAFRQTPIVQVLLICKRITADAVTNRSFPCSVIGVSSLLGFMLNLEHNCIYIPNE